jgi:gliding motility-associated-like protein
MKKLFFFAFLFSVFSVFAQSPTANFTATLLSVCEGSQVCFNASTSTTNGGSAIVSYSWDFGDGNSGTGVNVCHTYSTSGPKQVTLVVGNANGQADAEVKPAYINVKPSPTASFSILGQGCTVPLTLTFNNTSSTGAGFTYAWNFAPGQTSNVQNPPSQTYNSVGTYPISLIVTNPTTGCSSTVVQQISVSNYQAGITLPSVVCISQPVNFTDNSTAGANTWNWNFGEQGSSTDQNPTFTFNTAGTFNIQLASENTASGCSGSTSQTITVQPTPTPSFTGTPLTNCAPSVVNFVNTSTGGVSYSWDFGNNTPPFIGTNPPPQTYYANDAYTVSLTMTTATGCTGTTTIPAFINVTDVEAGFTASVTGGCAPLTVSFTSTSTSPNPTSNPIVSWNWNFGNNQTSNLQNPPAQVYQVGVYDVTLTVTTQSGCTATYTASDYIKVGLINSVNFTVDTTVNCIKTDFEFTSFVSTTPSNPDSTEITYYWEFGDGGSDGTSTDQNPTYQFTSDTGYFSVMLVVDYRGCKDTLYIDSLIYINAPISKFTPAETLFCNPNSLPVTLQITDDATHGVLSDDVLMIWKWDDGTPNTTLDDPQLDDADLGSITHDFANYGTYTVEQVIHNYTTGCSDSTTRTIDVSMVEPGFTLSNDSICQGDSLFMYDASSTWMTPPNPHPLESWEFDMGNNTAPVSMGDTANYVYQTAGSYFIEMTVTNSVGCSDSITLPITVLAPPFAVLSSDAAVGCDPFLVNFTNGSISLNGLALESFEYTFTDDSTTVTTTSIGTPVSHVFNGTGTFYAELTATDVFGCTSVPASNPITITKPSPFFSIDNVICNGESINTTNTSTGATPITYEWFIDGTSFSTDENTSTVFNEPNITFGVTSATHTISLVATDVNGCKDTIGNLVTVSIPFAIPTYSFSGAEPDTSGNYTCPPIFASFSDSSISYGNIIEWNWGFGDLTTSDLFNPSKTYALPGYFDLYLEVTDEYGCTADTLIEGYLIIGGPSGEPDWSQGAGVCSQGASFTVANPQNVFSSVWEMGDGDTITNDLDFNYNYASQGTYTPGVTLYDSLGCDIFYPLPPITVFDDGLTAAFTVNPNPVEQGASATVTDQSTSTGAPIASWAWDFGNSQTSLVFNNSNQSTTYPLGGFYDITLIVTDAIGCVDSITQSIFVKDPEIYVPNIFTPNGDGANDIFNLPFDGFKSFQITITNRWGNVVWDRQRDDTKPLLLWDGTDNGGNDCTDGVYFYLLTGEMKGGTMVSKNGFVTKISSK